MELISITSVPVIATAVYWLINLLKYITKDNETVKRCIPLIAAAFGVVLGIGCYYLLPAVIPADNIATALIIGGASGLSATGCNQIFKQINKSTGDESGKGS